MVSVIEKALDSNARKIMLTEEQYNQKIENYMMIIKQSVDEVVSERKKKEIDKLVKAGKFANNVNEKSIYFDVIQEVEDAINNCADLIISRVDFEGFHKLFDAIKSQLNLFAKARTAKIIMTVLQKADDNTDFQQSQIEVCEHLIYWCDQSNFNFLKYKLMTKILKLNLNLNNFIKCHNIVDPLIENVKKHDDKLLLVELYLVKAKLLLYTQNINASKSAITYAKTISNITSSSPIMQAEINFVSGQLHLELEDYSTAYSYFLEVLDTAMALKIENFAVSTFSYLILCTMLTNSDNDFSKIITGTFQLQLYATDEIKTMLDLLNAYKAIDLTTYRNIYNEKNYLFAKDIILSKHIKQSLKTVVEQITLDYVAAYDVIEISHLAKKVNLEATLLENYLARMLLDNIITGRIDQKDKVIYIHTAKKLNENYVVSTKICNDLVTIIERMSKYVDKLR